MTDESTPTAAEAEKSFDERFPEHAKMSRVTVRSQTIGEFLDSTTYELGEWVEADACREREDLPCDGDHPHFEPVRLSIEQVLAEYFGVDLAKVETEKREMLAILAKGATP